MKNSRLFPSFLVAAAMTVIFLTAARASENDTATIKFSDPTKPGTLKISVTNGDIHLHGSDAAEPDHELARILPSQRTELSGENDDMPFEGRTGRLGRG